MVRLLHSRFISESTSAESTAFSAAKDNMLATIAGEISEAAASLETLKEHALKRMRGIFTGASFLRPGDMFRLLTDNFSLQWNSEMFNAFESWNTQRHPLAHGSSTERLSVDDLIDFSRVAGAVNVLAACAIGYKGTVTASVIEDRRITIF